MRLSSRFILDNLFLLAAAFLVVASMTWSAGVAGWTAFGVSAAITVIAGTSAVLTARSGRKLGHGLVGLAALWSLVAALPGRPDRARGDDREGRPPAGRARRDHRRAARRRLTPQNLSRTGPRAYLTFRASGFGFPAN